MTPTERVILYNQYEILKRLNSDQATYYEEKQAIVERGFEQFYSQLNESIQEGSIPRHVTEHVMNTLDMFRAIHNSAKRLGYTPKSPWATFQGYDGNETDGHYAAAQFLRRTQGKWSEQSAAPDNSHSSGSVGHYGRMLEVWESLGRKFDLTADEIEKIAEA